MIHPHQKLWKEETSTREPMVGSGLIVSYSPPTDLPLLIGEFGRPPNGLFGAHFVPDTLMSSDDVRPYASHIIVCSETKEHTYYLTPPRPPTPPLPDEMVISSNGSIQIRVNSHPIIDVTGAHMPEYIRAKRESCMFGDDTPPGWVPPSIPILEWAERKGMTEGATFEEIGKAFLLSQLNNILEAIENRYDMLLCDLITNQSVQIHAMEEGKEKKKKCAALEQDKRALRRVCHLEKCWERKHFQNQNPHAFHQITKKS